MNEIYRLLELILADRLAADTAMYLDQDTVPIPVDRLQRQIKAKHGLIAIADVALRHGSPAERVMAQDILETMMIEHVATKESHHGQAQAPIHRRTA